MVQSYFEKKYNAALSEAADLYLARKADGRNLITPTEGMFPHGVSDILYEIYKKVNRALGNEKAGDSQQVTNELIDIINYAAFGIALETLRLEGVHHNVNIDNTSNPRQSTS